MSLAHPIPLSGHEQPRRHSADVGMVYLPGSTFRMGSDPHYPDEVPLHRLTVDGFWIDRTPVTNRQFRQFVEATGHSTIVAYSIAYFISDHGRPQRWSATRARPSPSVTHRTPIGPERV
jgi:formylglycine-generating enzyme required for sulfatase activity